MKRIVLALVALLALTVVVVAPAGAAVALTQRPLVSPDSRPYDYFGRSVDVSGTTAVVGAFHNHDHGSPGEVGAAYVYIRSGKSWKLQQKLKAPDGQDGDWFGTWVSISGSTVAVAAPTPGKVYIFVRTGTTWKLQQTLHVATPPDFDGRSGSMSLSGSTLAFPDGQTVKMYVRTGSTWKLAPALTQGNGDTIESVNVNGAGLVASAPTGGRVYVYTRTGTTWTLQQTLVARNGVSFDQAAVSGSTVAVSGGNAAGTKEAVSVYVRQGTIWQLQQILTTVSAHIEKSSLGLSGATVVVGGRDPAVTGGAAFVFTRSGTTWTLQNELHPAVNASSDRFAASVAVSGSVTNTGSSIVVGAPGTNGKRGAAYGFTS